MMSTGVWQPEALFWCGIFELDRASWGEWSAGISAELSGSLSAKQDLGYVAYVLFIGQLLHRLFRKSYLSFEVVRQFAEQRQPCLWLKRIAPQQCFQGQRRNLGRHLLS